MENGKWKMNFMDFLEISGKKSKKKFLLKMSLFYFSLDILEKLQVKAIKISKFENLAAPNTFFPAFTEENKILASFPSVKLELRRC